MNRELVVREIRESIEYLVYNSMASRHKCIEFEFNIPIDGYRDLIIWEVEGE